MQARTASSKLVDAVHRQSIEELTVLLAAGCDSYSSDTITAFTSACASCQLDIVKMFIAAGVNIHAKDEEALRWAAGNGYLEIVKELIAAGADVHAADDLPLHWAVQNGYLEIVKELLAAGADIHADDDHALQCAVENGYLDIVKELLAAGADRLKIENFEEKLLKMI